MTHIRAAEQDQVGLKVQDFWVYILQLNNTVILTDALTHLNG